jgi:hypothetical protein
MKTFNKLCTPANIYLGIAVISTIIALLNGIQMIYAFWKIFFALIWTFVLGWLCKKGYTSISWFLVLLPYVLILLAMLNIYRVTEKERRVMRAIKLQGAYGQEAFIEGFGFRRKNNEVSIPPAPDGQAKKLPNWMKKQETIIEEDEPVLEDTLIIEDEVVIEENPILEQDEVVIEEEPLLEDTVVDETITSDDVVSTNNSPFGSLSYFLGG